MNYLPGSHLIATLKTDARESLEKYERCIALINSMIEEFSLEKLGDVNYNFPGGGFTLVVCLSESHLSIHTWPEHGICNLDIYLSNFERVNNETVTKIFHRLVVFFDADVISQLTVCR